MSLPAGVDLYRLGSDGRFLRTTAEGTRSLHDDPALLPFIDDGQRAHYLIGDAGSGPAAPSTATVKVGVVAPHSAFRPHVHGAEHVVLSLGSASCTVIDDGRVVELALPPGHLVRLPAWLPHAFANRAASPLLILAANTGLGIAHDDYAVTVEEAQRRAAQDTQRRAVDDPPWADIAAGLRLLDGRGVRAAGARERLAAGLRALAERLEGLR